MKFGYITLTGFLIFITVSFPKTVLAQTWQVLEDITRNERLRTQNSSYLDEAEKNIRNGNLKMAISNYDKAIETFPQDYQSYILRGKTKAKLEKYEEAIEDYSLAILIEPLAKYDEGSLSHKIYLRKNSEALFYRGQAKNNMGDFKGALEDFSKSIKLYKSSNAFLAMGSIKGKEGLHKDAIEDYTNAVNLDNNNIAYLMRGSSLIQLGKIDEACEDFTKIIESQYKKEVNQLMAIFCDD